MSSVASAAVRAANLDALNRASDAMAQATTDQEVTAKVKQYLPALIDWLDKSEHADVRTKIMGLIVHINKRVKDNHNIQLPVTKILELYEVTLEICHLSNFCLTELAFVFRHRARA